MTLPPSPAPLTPKDRKVSLADPFEVLRAYAQRDRSRLGDISGPSPLLDECDVALHGLATGCLWSDVVQELSSSNSPRASCGVKNISTSGSSLNHRRDAKQLLFEPSRTNATRDSLDTEQPCSHAREFHIQLAATDLGGERGTVRVPADVDPDYIRFREELKQKLMSKGDGCIWRGLKSQDEPRL